MSKRDPSPTPLENMPLSKRPKDRNIDDEITSEIAPATTPLAGKEGETSITETDKEKIERLERELADQTKLVQSEKAAKDDCLKILDSTRESNSKTITEIHRSYKSQITDLIGAHENMQQQIRELQKENNKMRLEALEQPLTLRLEKDEVDDRHTVESLKAKLEATERAYDEFKRKIPESGSKLDTELVQPLTDLFAYTNRLITPLVFPTTKSRSRPAPSPAAPNASRTTGPATTTPNARTAFSAARKTNANV